MNALANKFNQLTFEWQTRDSMHSHLGNIVNMFERNPLNTLADFFHEMWIDGWQTEGWQMHKLIGPIIGWANTQEHQQANPNLPQNLKHYTIPGCVYHCEKCGLFYTKLHFSCEKCGLCVKSVGYFANNPHFHNNSRTRHIIVIKCVSPWSTWQGLQTRTGAMLCSSKCMHTRPNNASLLTELAAPTSP